MLLSCYQTEKTEAGIDEAGRGCLAGPVVAAAVIFPKDYTHPLLNDSKQLSYKQRVELKNDILRDAIAYQIAEVSEKVIDEINILNAVFKAMHRCIDTLAVKPEFLIIDGHLFRTNLKIPYQCVVKGDGKYLSIAAASILAKTYRDDLMIQMASKYPEYKWEKNMGYATKDHRDAIKKYGLTEFHRKTFHLKDAQLGLF